MTEEIVENTTPNNEDNNLSIFDDIKLPYEKYPHLIENIHKINNIMPNLNYDKHKELDKIEKKIQGFLSLYRELNNNYSTFFNKSIIDVRRNIKLEKKKNKENKDKSKYYVNIQKNAPPFILKMMNKNCDEKVSQSQVLSALIQKIKKCLTSNYTTHVVYKESDTTKVDKTKFKITDELLIFFNEIKDEAKSRGNDIIIPEILGYPNLMSYMQYFIYKDKDKDKDKDK